MGRGCCPNKNSLLDLQELPSGGAPFITRTITYECTKGVLIWTFSVQVYRCYTCYKSYTCVQLPWWLHIYYEAIKFQQFKPLFSNLLLGPQTHRISWRILCGSLRGLGPNNHHSNKTSLSIFYQFTCMNISSNDSSWT